MKKSILIVLALAVACSAIPLFASNYYEKGNTFFSINAGISLPMMIKDSEEGLFIFDNTHLKLGGYGSLSYQACVSPLLAIGGELGYNFNYVVDGKIFTQVPITAKATLIPVQTGKFDLNIVANLGINFIKYTDVKQLVPFASFSLNPVVYVTDNWGIGLLGGAASYIEFSSGCNALSLSTPVVLTVIYRR